MPTDTRTRSAAEPTAVGDLVGDFVENVSTSGPNVPNADAAVGVDTNTTIAGKNACAPVMDRIRTLLDEHSFKNWFGQVRLEFQNKQLSVYAPSQFYADWLKDHYLDLIHQAAECLPEFKEAVFKVDQALERRPAATRAAGGSPDNATGSSQANSGHEPLAPLPPQYTFGNFVETAETLMALAAAKTITFSPAPYFLSCTFWGPPGVGKSHLAQAILADAKQRNRQLGDQRRKVRVVYVTAEEFLNQYLAGISASHKRNCVVMQNFREKYRHAKILIIEDVEFFCGKPGVQTEFLETFKAITEGASRGVVLMISNLSPKEIRQRAGWNPALLSRILGGTRIHVSSPSLDSRKAILRKKAAALEMSLSEKAIDFLAAKITSIRELEGALSTIRACAEVLGGPLTDDTVRLAMTDHLDIATAAPITIERIKGTVARHFGVSVADLEGKCRERKFVWPRQVAITLSKRLLLEASDEEIGAAFKKDRSTVLHAIKRVEGDMFAPGGELHALEQLLQPNA